MTVINLDDKKGAWFDMEGGGRVQLQTVSAETFRAIRKQTVKKVPEYKRLDGKAERFEVEQADEDLQNELFWDAVIVGWEKLFDGKGNEIPCTKENKALLMTRSAKFAKFIADSIKTLSEDEAAELEASEKN
jgi:hypothetical protein